MPAVDYHPPVKRSIEIAGHKTSVSLEPVFWTLLLASAREEGVPLNALVARIDADRLAAARTTGLAGALRLWLVARLQGARIAPSGDHEATGTGTP